MIDQFYCRIRPAYVNPVRSKDPVLYYRHDHADPCPWEYRTTCHSARPRRGRGPQDPWPGQGSVRTDKPGTGPWRYSGSEGYYGKALGERRKDIFLTSKSHSRDREGALAHLHETLRNMRTDHLDLWQVHDVREDQEIADIFGPGGAIEAFVQAKQQGKTRFIGVTGHHNPFIIKKCIELFDFDTVLMPVNPAEQQHQSFIEHVLPLAREKNMGIIGMKVYFRGFASRLPWYAGMEPFFRFALSQTISNVVIGCDDSAQLEQNAAFARSFAPLSPQEQRDLIRSVSPFARQLMYYKP
jgi:predicted aldo/keto reductase-like oxidoreductase